MADEELVARVRHVLAGEPVTEQRMFGGTCFLLNGNMIAGASSRGLMLRVGKDNDQAALARPFAEPMIMRDRPMGGFIRVGAEGIERDSDLAGWIEFALGYVRTLPPKAKPTPRKRVKVSSR